MNINFGLQDPNAFARGMEQGRKPFDDMAARQEKARADNALRAFATNPNDPGAVNALAQVDPRLAIQVGQQQQRRQAELSEASRANVIKGAQIVRQIQPKNQAGWDQALNAAQMAGIDISTVPREFNPQVAERLIGLADTFEPAKTEQPTSLQRNYEFLSQQDPELGKKYLTNQASPLRFVPDGVGGVTVVDPSAFVGAGGAAVPNAAPERGAGPPAVLTDDDWETGGQASAPGNFPESGFRPR